MIKIKRYNPEHKDEWDTFVFTSKNGTFLHKRDFMEYHSNRFQDFSILFYDENKLIALLPANIFENVLYSHQGLTYGGLILGMKGVTITVLNIFEELIKFLRGQGISRLIYKVIPYIYHKQAAEEDLYALFRNDAKLIIRNISSCIYLQDRIKYSQGRKEALKKSKKNNLSVHESLDFSAYWNLLCENLQKRYNAKPVHSLEEINHLRSKFPENIKLFQVERNGNVISGVVMFEMENIVHVQYISSNEEGRSLGAVDAVFDYLLDSVYEDKIYFDFGISTEKNGLYLNEGLINQKEGFGGRGVVYDTYQVDIK